MGIPQPNESDKMRPQFTMDGEDHPMIHGMKVGQTYHMKVKAKMVGHNVHKGKHSASFEIHHASEHGKASYKDILKDGSEEESTKHENTESKHTEDQEGE